jgi:hypothetical protein
MKTDYDWETYVSQAGHDIDKMEVVRELAELVESSTPWTAKRSKNQIVYQDAGERVLTLQFWGKETRLALVGLDGSPDPNPLAPVEARRGVRPGVWWWNFRSTKDVPATLDRLLALRLEPSSAKAKPAGGDR